MQQVALQTLTPTPIPTPTPTLITPYHYWLVWVLQLRPQIISNSSLEGYHNSNSNNNHLGCLQVDIIHLCQIWIITSQQQQVVLIKVSWLINKWWELVNIRQVSNQILWWLDMVMGKWAWQTTCIIHKCNINNRCFNNNRCYNSSSNSSNSSKCKDKHQ